MKSIVHWFKRLIQSVEDRERKRRDTYLAQSVDVYDLEYRMRQVEERRSRGRLGRAADRTC